MVREALAQTSSGSDGFELIVTARFLAAFPIPGRVNLMDVVRSALIGKWRLRCLIVAKRPATEGDILAVDIWGGGPWSDLFVKPLES